jgi:site-specific recombinase XerD
MKRSVASAMLSEVITAAEWHLLADQPSRTSHAGIRNLAILHAMYFAGLGFADVCELSPWDLSERATGIYVSGSRSDRRELISLSGKSWAVIENWDDVRPPSPYFFSTLRGNRLDEQYVQGFLRRYGDRAGITHPTRVVAASYDPGFLERSYAGRLFARGLPEKGIARALSGALR